MRMSHGEMIAVITAHRDGKKIECRSLSFRDTGWSEYGNGERFAFDTHEYRIKPDPAKPREWWAFPMAHGNNNVKFYELGTQERAAGMTGIIHVREVLPDEEGKA